MGYRFPNKMGILLLVLIVPLIFRGMCTLFISLLTRSSSEHDPRFDDIDGRRDDSSQRPGDSSADSRDGCRLDGRSTRSSSIRGQILIATGKEDRLEMFEKREL